MKAAQRLLIKFFFLTVISTAFFYFMSCKQLSNSPAQNSGNSNIARIAVLRASMWMDSAQYDSAQLVLQDALRLSSIQDDSIHWYYLHSYLAEVMYYHALFSEGRALNKQAMEVAQKIGDSTLIGNCSNFSGLFRLNQDQPEDALDFFRNASLLILANHGNKHISYQYQVFSNMAEAFLALKQPDSAIHYAVLSEVEAKDLNAHRELAINRWIIGESLLLKKNYSKADSMFRLGLALVEQGYHADIHQFILASLLKSAAATGNAQQAKMLMATGLMAGEKKRVTIFSNLSFLKEVVKAAKLLSMPESAEMEADYFAKREEQETRGVQQRTRALQIYYQNINQLREADALKEQSKKELQITKQQEFFLVLLLLSTILFIVFGGAFFYQRYQVTTLLHQEEILRLEAQRELDVLREKNRVIEEERNRIARELHDQVGSSLSSILIYSSLSLEKYPDQPDKILQLTKNVKDTAIQISENLADLIWAMQSRNDSMEKVIERMKAFAFQLFSAQGAEIHFHIDYNVMGIHPDWEQRKNILLFFKEAVNNTAKHSGATRVDIKLEQLPGDLLLEVKDNGKGFDASAMRMSNGLKSLQSRGMALGGATEIVAAEGKGTVIRCRIPFPFAA